MGFSALARWWELEELGGFEGSYIFANVVDPFATAMQFHKLVLLNANCSLNKTLNKNPAENLNQNSPKM